MKAIIDGKRYDTETAQELAHFWNGLGSSDFRCVSEGLYKTKNGAYFLAGQGGALTMYAEACGNATSEGERITPMSVEEAILWLEKRNKHGIIEREFSANISDA